MPGPEASQSTMNDRSKSCSWNIGAVDAKCALSANHTASRKA
jgi:hypothetical protein